MSSGRSARLPLTPTAPSSNNVQRSALEPNSNNMQYYNPSLGPTSGSSLITTDVTGDKSGETDTYHSEMAVTSQVLESLSENERNMIIEVLNRDESVRQRDATRIM